MEKPETKLKKKVAADLNSLKNIWHLKTQEVATRGIPDFLICLNGLFVAIELKSHWKILPDRLQRFILNKIERKGKGICFVVSPENWEETLGALQKIDAGTYSKP